MRPAHTDESGFTLIELLVVISILGIISFALTEAVILGLRTTDGITSDVSNSVAVQALRSYVISDVQKAQKVSTDQQLSTNPADPCGTSTAANPVFLQLSWMEGERSRRVSYSLDSGAPPVLGQAELVRSSCTDSSVPTDKRVLGHFEFDPSGSPVLASCSPDCATATTVTLKILTNRPRNPPAPIELTMRRRLT